MGMDITVKILKWNRDLNIWEQVKLYTKEGNEFYIIDPYPFRNSELFSFLNDTTTNTLYQEEYNVPTMPIQINTLPEDLKEEIFKKEKDCFFGFKEINLSDLKLYLSYAPKIKYWDDFSGKDVYKDNPVKHFIEKIENYINLASFYKYKNLDFVPSDIKILFWFDN